MTAEACPQFAGALGGAARDATGIVGQEDCLYLDLYAPRFAPDAVPTGDARLPVLLWIHGGATMGRAGMWDGGKLAASQDVVVVAIQYRMGAFGWFHHPALRAEATPADGGQMTRPMPSLAATDQACTGPAPPVHSSA